MIKNNKIKRSCVMVIASSFAWFPLTITAFAQTQPAMSPVEWISSKKEVKSQTGQKSIDDGKTAQRRQALEKPKLEKHYTLKPADARQLRELTDEIVNLYGAPTKNKRGELIWFVPDLSQTSERSAMTSVTIYEGQFGKARIVVKKMSRQRSFKRTKSMSSEF